MTESVKGWIFLIGGFLIAEPMLRSFKESNTKVKGQLYSSAFCICIIAGAYGMSKVVAEKVKTDEK